jgi:hypothetical protein
MFRLSEHMRDETRRSHPFHSAQGWLLQAFAAARAGSGRAAFVRMQINAEIHLATPKKVGAHLNEGSSFYLD